MILNKNLTIDLNHTKPTDHIYLHVDDVNSVVLVLQILKDGSPVAFSSATTVKYDAVIAGHLAEQDADGDISNDTVKIYVTPNMVALPGLLEIDVKLIEATSVLYTQTIKVTVNRSVIEGSTIIDLSGTTIGKRLDNIEEGLQALFKYKLDALPGAVKTEHLADRAVTTDKIAGGAVTEPIIYNGAVSTVKIKDKAVTATKLANGCVISDKIPDGEIGGEKIEDGTLTSNLLADGSITTEKLDSSLIDDTPTKHTDSKVHLVTSDGVKAYLNKVDDTLQDLTRTKLDDSGGSVKASNLGAGVVTVSKIADGAVTTQKLNSSFIDSTPTIHTDSKVYLITSDGVKNALNVVDEQFVQVNADISNKMSLITNSSSTANLPAGQIAATPDRNRYFAVKRKGGSVADGGLLEIPTLSAEQNCPDDNYAWYSDHSWNCKLRGSYFLVGNLCVLLGRASLIENWNIVYYSLPKAALSASSTIAITNDVNFTINTDTLSNTSVMRIAKFDNKALPSGEVFFTLIYRYS